MTVESAAQVAAMCAALLIVVGLYLATLRVGECEFCHHCKNEQAAKESRNVKK